MANDLMVLNPALSLALRDPLNQTWGQDEVDDLLTWSVARMWPRYSRALTPADATITLVSGTYYYDLPEGCLAVSRIDLLDSSGNDLGPISGRAWEITGDVYALAGQVHISPMIASTGGTLKLHGYGRYIVDSPDGETGLVPDDFVPLVLARARAEAYRRLAADREKFKAWLSRSQTQNVSVNELLQMVNEADAEALRLERQLRTWQKPVSGRTG
jgi:hypothetical protein